MKKIFEGEVFEILPLSGGIIFSYLNKVTEDGVIVSYKMISFETGRFTDVAKNIYMLSKFGNNYRAVSAFCDNYITVKSLVLPGGKVFLLEPDGKAQLIDNDATPVWSGSLTYRGSAPSDIVLYNDALWASYADCNALLRYNLATMREELRVGGMKSPFKKPRSLFIEGDSVMVCNWEAQNLLQVDLNNYNVFEYESFDEPVYQYVKVGDNRFVLLKSGLYLI